MNNLALVLVAVGILSISCQFLAYKIKIPAILLLLVVGILVGPTLGIINADTLFGDLLFPVVSLSVAIILFEGALTLRFKDLSGHGSMVRNLCTIGAIVTWFVAAIAAHYALGITWQMAFLFGAIVTVTGPTVIVPMLRTVRPDKKIGRILTWEGIVIDPIGALLAVLVFEYIISTKDALTHTLLAFGLTIGVGLVIGAVTGYLMGLALRKHLIPHYLTNTAVLTIMLGAFEVSNIIAHESGLLTVTVMGMWLANMKNVDVDDILEFKETLSVLLISGLFILLASRIELDAILNVGWGSILVLIAIIFIARPMSVFISGIGTGLKVKELALLSWIAPRGIVAAAVSALFALKLELINYAQVELLVPMVFLVIITTVVLQSLTSSKIADLLGLRAPKPDGFLLFGGGQFGKLFAKELISQKIDVCVADTNWDNIKEARMDNIPTYFGNPMSEHASRNLNMTPLGKVLVMSPYRQLNPLVTFHFESELGKGSVIGLSNNEQQQGQRHQVSSNYVKKLGLFKEDISYGKLASWVSKGAQVKTTKLSDSFSFEHYIEEYNERCIPLCVIDNENKVSVFTTQYKPKAKPGYKIISLILSESKPVKEAISTQEVDEETIK